MPLQDKAIYLQDFIIPVITDKCTGCGICVERCPNVPERSVDIIPTGMGDAGRAGLYHLRKRLQKGYNRSDEVLHGEALLNEKGKMSAKDEFEFEYNFNTETKPEGWE